MNDLRSHLQRGDPLSHEGGLTPADAMRMRRNILSAAPVANVGTGWRFVSVTAMLILVCVGSIWFVRVAVPEPVVLRAEQPHQQLQFSAPNGTRIIWTFNPDLEVR